MNKECPLWARSDVCSGGNTCNINQCCTADVPLEVKESSPIRYEGVQDPWETLLGLDEQTNPLAMFEFDEALDYYDLRLNTPGNTNYKGKSLWGYIYDSHCLKKDVEVTCDETTAFNRLISGMQTVIAALNSEHSDDGALVPFSLGYFKHAVSHNQDWLDNMYFTQGMLMRSLCHLEPMLTNMECAGIEGCASFKQLISKLSSYHSCRAVLHDEDRMFTSQAIEAVQSLGTISDIMDCVECEKCRLHAKVKTSALQTLVKNNSQYPVVSLSRDELIGLLYSTLYFSEGVIVVERFRQRLLAMRVALGVVLACAGLMGLWFVRCVKRRIFKNKMKDA